MSFARNPSDKIWENLLDPAKKKGLDAAKTASKIVVHKTAEATRELIGDKITKEIVKPKPVPDENSRDVEEVVILPGKNEEILNKLRQVL